MKLLITIDTEADNQWEHGCEISVANIRYIPRFQELCDKYLIRPTYLVTSEVCEDAFAKELFRGFIEQGKAEIGAHLHSWTTPPFRDPEGLRYNDKNHAFASELPLDLLEAKINNLTHQIETSFGKRPLSFRSGRYGFDSTVAQVLVNNSYLVDSSVTPFINWSDHKGIPGGKNGPDFSTHTPFPFKYNFENGSLLELPVTILPTRFPLNKNHQLARTYFKNVDSFLLLKILRRLNYSRQPLWLRPFDWMNRELFAEILKESERLGLPYIVMMFHSSELMPGGSGYWPDEKAVNSLFQMLESFFILSREHQIQSSTLTDTAINQR
jgi:hypothetical protein